MNHVAQVVDLIRSGLNPGQPRGSHGLTLVPLFGGAPAKEYLTAEEAFGAGLLEIALEERCCRCHECSARRKPGGRPRRGVGRRRP